MKRVERHIVIKNNNLDHLCFLSKNLYNYCLYQLRQDYFKNRELDKPNYLKEYELTTLLTKENQIDYRSLPSQTSQQVIKLLFKNWKSFWRSLKEYQSNPDKFLGKPKLPKYKHKIKGRNIAIFTNQQCILKDNFIHFPKLSKLDPLQTKVNNFQQIRIVPQSSCYIIEVIYNKEGKKYDLNSGLYLSIDLGLNNLATLINNSGLSPLIINGKIIKSINQYYNKEKAKLMSFIGDVGFSNRISNLELRRSNLVSNYLHHVSKFIISYCINNKISNIVIGKNTNWKQEISLGRVNNQKFVQIPFEKLIQQIQYKSEEVGIKVILQEESYTSKCDSLGLEEIKKQE